MRFIDAEQVAELGYSRATEVIEAALRAGYRPGSDTPRMSVELERGEYLIMPSQVGAATGVKVLTIAPDNPTRGLPRIDATYLLYEAESLALQAILDGTALTTLRTPAVSMAALRPRLGEEVDVVIIGSGPQAVGHADAIRAVTSATVTYVVRDPTRAQMNALALGSAAASDALARADVIVCATSAREPLFDGALVRDDASVVAVGSHEPDARELDSALLGRSFVVVEDRATALREAGDVVMAIKDGALTADDLHSLADVVTGAVAPGDRPYVVKTVGMAWEDLVLAAALAR